MALTKITTDIIADGAITSAHLASGAVTHSSLSSITTDNVSEGSTNLYFTNARVDTEIDSYLSGGTGVTYSSGAISIGQSVATNSNVTFADLTLTGNLNITGDINSYNVTDLDVTDQTITLGAGQTEALSGGSGIIVDGSGASILWDETNDVFDFNKGLTTLGNVGIGTDNPTSNTLTITGKYLLLSDSQTKLGDNGTIGGGAADGNSRLEYYTGKNFSITQSGTNRMTINSDGNVGIGTDNPQDALHIKNPTASVGDAQVILEGQPAGYGAGISFQAELTGGSLKEMARIVADGSASWNTTTTTQDARLRFFTTGDGTETEGMALHSNGLLVLGESPSSVTARGTGYTRQLIKMGDNQAYLELQGYDANEEVGMLMSSGSTGDYGQVTYNLQYDNLRLNAKSMNRVYISENATEGAMIRANAWWNGSPANIGGPAMEIGYVGAYAYCLGYDRLNSVYKNVLVDGYTVGFATSGTTRAEVNGYGITPYQDNLYDLGTEATTSHWRRSYFKGTSNTGESNGQPDLSKTSRGAIHIELPSSGSSSGITFGAGSYSPSQTQAGIVCHNNGSDGTHLGFFTTYTYSGGPYCRMKITNYGAIIGGVNVDLTSTSAPSNTTFYSTNGDIKVQADNGDHYISDLLPGYNRGQFGCMAANGNYMYFAVNGYYAAYLTSSGTLSASDERLKENVTTLTGSLDKINQLRGVSFNWKNEARGTGNNIGFIAQEVESVYPELVGDGGLPDIDGESPHKHVNYEKLVPALVEAIKELKTKLEAAEARIETLENP